MTSSERGRNARQGLCSPQKPASPRGAAASAMGTHLQGSGKPPFECYRKELGVLKFRQEDKEMQPLGIVSVGRQMGKEGQN